MQNEIILFLSNLGDVTLTSILGKWPFTPGRCDGLNFHKLEQHLQHEGKLLMMWERWGLPQGLIRLIRHWLAWACTPWKEKFSRGRWQSVGTSSQNHLETYATLFNHFQLQDKWQSWSYVWKHRHICMGYSARQNFAVDLSRYPSYSELSTAEKKIQKTTFCLHIH